MISNGKPQKSIQSENLQYSELEIILAPYFCEMIPEKVLYTSLANHMIITLLQHSARGLEFNFQFFLMILSIKGHLQGLN